MSRTRSENKQTVHDRPHSPRRESVESEQAKYRASRWYAPPIANIAFVPMPEGPRRRDSPAAGALLVLGQRRSRDCGACYALADLRCSDSPDFRRGLCGRSCTSILDRVRNRFFVMLQWVMTFLTKRRQVRVFPGQERAAEAQ